MLPRDGPRGRVAGGAGGNGSPSWSSGNAASFWRGGSGGGGGRGGAGGGGGRSGDSSSAASSLFTAALAAACVALVVTVASVRELRTVVQAQRQQQQQQQQVDELHPLHLEATRGGGSRGGGHGGWALAAATAPAAAPPPPLNVPGALLLGAADAPGCRPMPATEMWGDVVRWGSTHKLDSSAACCAACRAYAGGGGGASGSSGATTAATTTTTTAAATEDEAVDCNVWVWCGDAQLCGGQHRECWLKHLAHPTVARPMRQGPGVGWTSGIVADRGGGGGAGGGGAGGGGGDGTTASGGGATEGTPPVGVAAEIERAAALEPNSDRRYHTVTTAQGPAVHWQSRVHYYHFLKQKAACEAEKGVFGGTGGGGGGKKNGDGGKSADGKSGGGGGCEMGGWTRLLHSGEADDLMDELPTFLADPLPESVVPHAWYPVLNRPYALLQWIEKADIPERYILMSEPDHLWLRPLPNLAPSPGVPAAFPFFYIEPHRDEYLPLAARFARSAETNKTLTRKEAMLIAPIGNSPTFLSTALARAVIPEWQRLSVAIFSDKEANKAWGWVQEMYAFTFSLFNLGVRRALLAPELAAQPPWDASERARDARAASGEGEPFYMIHYTYGCDYARNGTHMRGRFGEWRFDKRTYAGKAPPRHLGAPPDGLTNPHVRALISAINEATSAIPCWEAYRALGRVAECGDERAGGVWVGVEERAAERRQRRREAAAEEGGATGGGG